MNTKNNITTDPQERFLEGISQVSEVIRASFGPKGSNVAIEREIPPYHEICNDAESIIQSIHIGDPVARRGLNFLKELSARASKSSGEGRKTTIIIAETLLKEGFKEKVKGMKLAEELNALLPSVIENIDKQTKRVEIEDIYKVAETSSRDKITGQWIQKIYNEIDRDGIITVEGSGMAETFYEVTDGVRLRCGTVTPYMQGEYVNPIIVVSKQKVERDSDIDKLVTAAHTQNRPLILFLEDCDNNVASRLIATHRAGIAKICIIKAPILWKNYIFEDFAKCTGATIVGNESGVSLKGVKDEHLGTCEKIIVDEEVLLRGISDLKAHKENLREKGDNDSLLRLQWLNTKSATLKLGSLSESELSYKLLKCKDAINSCRLALSEGICVGAGEALLIASKDLPDTVAGNILKKALESPYKQLLLNNEI